jgi:hypothetical protein
VPGPAHDDKQSPGLQRLPPTNNSALASSPSRPPHSQRNSQKVDLLDQLEQECHHARIRDPLLESFQTLLALVLVECGAGRDGGCSGGGRHVSVADEARLAYRVA